MLADSHTVSRDGLVYTFKLRQGIKFHNGKEMTSEDVVPSLARWGKQSIYGKSLFAQVDTWKAIDKYTVEMKLKEKSAIVLISLAVPNNFGAIYPKEIAEKFEPAVKATEYIGTGPYKLAEWKPDQYIRMVRFDEYKSRAEKPTATAGARPPTWTRSAGCRCPRWPRGWPRWRRVSWTSPTISTSTPSIGSRRTRPSVPSCPSPTTGSSRSSTRRKA
jgi:ABC-type transport system substrate-binding protein